MIPKLSIDKIISSAAVNSSILVLGQENKIENITFRQRDLIYLTDTKCNIISRGSIFKITQNQIEVLLNDIDPDDLSDEIMYNLLLSGSDVTFQYNNKAIEQVEKGSCIGKNGLMFINKLLGQDIENQDIQQNNIQYNQKRLSQVEQFLNNSYFNEEQKEAIKNIALLDSGEFYTVQGCPGSGKTCMLAAAIKLYLQLNPSNRVLITGPSNISVDNLLSKLTDLTCNKVRIGQASRIYDETLTKYCVDNQLQIFYGDEFKQLQHDIKQQQLILDRMQKKMQKQASFKAQFYEARTKLREVNKEYRKQTQNRVQSVLQDSQCVFATLSGCCHKNSLQAAQPQGFDLVVIDEAGQALDKDIMQALMLCKGSVAICGDPAQLGATILSEKLKSNKLFNSRLLERLCKIKANFTLLKQTYRLPQITCDLISSQFYNNELKTQNKNDEEKQLIFIDTADQEGTEVLCEGDYELCSKSIKNPFEVKIIRKLLDQIEFQQEDIGIIAPYSAQVQLIQQELQVQFPNIEIHTVDGFQGREKRCIILSMTRSNQDNEIGFIGEPNRLNVMLSRAKEQLVIIGNSTTLSSDINLSPIIDYLFDNAECLDLNDFI